jgi:hypothetical protein
MLARARYTRLNSRYRAAHSWARLILGGGGVTDPVEHSVEAAPDLTHAAVAEFLQQFVTTGDGLLRQRAPVVRAEASVAKDQLWPSGR